MKKKLLLLLITGLFFANSKAQTLLYSNDFENGLDSATVLGTGAIEATTNTDHGKVFHNAVSAQGVRTNYLILPHGILGRLQSSGIKGLTISFWVNKGTASGYYWSPIFSAYGAAPSGGANTWPMMVLQTRGVVQVNNNGWCDFTDAQNVKAANTVSTTWIDDSNWHFYSVVFTETSTKVYIDGAVMNEWTLTGAAGSTVSGLFTSGSALQYICLGGNQAWNWADPDPAFLYDKLNIYAGALTSAQISSLMTTDQLAAPVLTANTSAIYLDDKYSSTTMVVNGANLSSDISISAPTGVTVSPTSISKSAATDVNVTVSFNGSTITSGNITLTSGSMSKTVYVNTTTNAAYTPAYSTGNMIADPTFSATSLSTGGFGGWGPTGIINKNAYSGRGSAYVRGSCWPDGGSIDRTLSDANSNALKANTKYRLRAMVKSQATAGTYFQFQIEGYDGTASKYILIGNTNGWKQIDTIFTTGTTVTTGKGIYFNACSSATPALTDTAFIDNYEMYEVTFTTSVNGLTLSESKAYIQNSSVITEYYLNKPANISLTILDIQGKTLLARTIKSESGFNRNSLEVKLPQGIYIVKVASNEFIYSRKIISDLK